MMNQSLSNRLSALQVQAPQQFRNLTAFALVSEDLPDPDHVMLKEALAQGFLTVEEVSQGGSVPELVVVNDSDHFVLLLDGEEVSGAKQNRVLNTSILLDKRSRTLVPVSCTEAGRWAYSSAQFAYSGNIMSSKLRRRKSRSVSESLKTNACYSSDQSEVWDSISELHLDAGTSSSTGAMKDAFESRKDQLQEYAEAIRPVERQVGLLVFIDNRPAGFDLFSKRHSYATVAEQLAQSYAMDAVTSRQRDDEAAKTCTVTLKEAVAFIKSLRPLKEDPFASIGVGDDYRYEGPGRNGSALLVGETPVHAAFFSTADEPGPKERPGRMSSASRRRHFRRNRGQGEGPEDV